MNCREFADFLDLYFDRRLSDAERNAFDEHMAECPACVAYLDGYRKTTIIARRAEEIERSLQAAPVELLQAILAACGKTSLSV